MLKICLIFILASIGTYSCTNDHEEIQFNHQMFDTIPENLLLAAFNEDDAMVILLADKNDSSIISKLIFRKNFPVYIDTLERIKHLEFKSKHFNQTYRIEDSAVKMFYIESMVHPCYTWQGQTPVTRAMTLTFKKIKLNE